jgi:hypothetical protein
MEQINGEGKFVVLVAAVRIWKEIRERSMERGLRMAGLLVFPIGKKSREETRSCVFASRSPGTWGPTLGNYGFFF